VRGRSELRIGVRRSGGEAIGGGDAGAPFYMVGGGAWQPGNGGQLAVSVVCHDGCGGGCFERGSTRAVVGSDEGGCFGHFTSERGCQEVVRVLTREAAVVAVWPREKDDRAGPHVGERVWGGLAGPAKG
jgi:hypothetical protein